MRKINRLLVAGLLAIGYTGVSQAQNAVPLYKTGNVLAIGIWNDNNTSSDLAVSAELVDNNGVIYAQDSAATGGWPSGTKFTYKVVLSDTGAGAEEPNWQQRGFDDSAWTTNTIGFTVGHGGNVAENGETLLVAANETVYTRSVFDANNYETISEVTIRVAADDEAVVWLNGTFIGFTAAGTSDRGETAENYVFDTTIAGGLGGLEGGSNPSTYSGNGTKVFVKTVTLADAQSSVVNWNLYE